MKNKDWRDIRIRDLLDYEQPTKYLTNNIFEKNNGYYTPVITANKKFILGYTNDKEGIYNKTPVIVFDDFTTDSKLVDFNFKVKSSAIKILKLKDNNTNIKFLFERLKLIKPQTIDHKRHYLSEFEPKVIQIPPLKEQEKIASILTSVDNSIEQTQKTIENNQKLKKGLLNKLLRTGIKNEELKKVKYGLQEIEIPNSWSIVILKDIIKLCLRPRKKPNSIFRKLGIYCHRKGTFVDNNFEPEKLAIDTLYEVKENDLIVNITFAWEGAIAVAKKEDDGALVSHRFPTYEFNLDKVLPEYFKYYILQKEFTHQLGLISPGGAGRNRVMSKKEFLNIPIILPSTLEEQEKIASILQTIDKKIELEQKKKQQLEQLKKGLMQQLLTGKMRVEVKE